MKKKVAGLLSALLLIVTLSGCGAFSPSFLDYDVSGYVTSLLGSSYLQNHTGYMEFTKRSEEVALQNNTTTVQNGAVYFCNAYGIYPSDEQMTQIEEIMRQAYLLSKFTVKEKVKTDTGFTVDVVIEPLTIFQNCTAEFETVRKGIKNGALKVGSGAGSVATPKAESSEAGEERSDENSDEGDGEGSKAPESSAAAVNTLDQNTLFVNEVIRICQEKVNAAPTYGSAVTITMNILQSEEGDLSLDLKQLEEIDRTVLLLPNVVSSDASISTASES